MSNENAGSAGNAFNRLFPNHKADAHEEDGPRGNRAVQGGSSPPDAVSRPAPAELVEEAFDLNELLTEPPEAAIDLLYSQIWSVERVYTDLGSARARAVHLGWNVTVRRKKIDERLKSAVKYRATLVQLAAKRPSAPPPPAEPTVVDWPTVDGERYNCPAVTYAMLAESDRDDWEAMRLTEFTIAENVQAIRDMEAEEARLKAIIEVMTGEVVPAFERALAQVQAYEESLADYEQALRDYEVEVDPGYSGPRGPLPPEFHAKVRQWPLLGALIEVMGLTIEPERDLLLPVEHFPYTRPSGPKGVPAPINHSANYTVLLKESGFDICYDVIEKEVKVTVHGQPLPKSDHEGEVLLRRATDLCVVNRLPLDGLASTLTALASGNQVNPVVNHLSSLVWDGKPRFDALVDALGASDPAAARASMRIFLVQACAAADGAERGMRANSRALPRYETVLLLQGEQGTRKTSGLRRLLPPALRGYFQDGVTLVIGDRDSERQAISSWVSELGELEATFRRSDVAQLKSFLSRQEDRLRVAYGRTDSRFQRRTVFVGTVNSEKVLADLTGNRRYGALSITTMDIGWRDAEVEQLWAEAWHRYCGGEQWWPTDEEAVVLRGAAEQFESVSSLEERLLARYDWERGTEGMRKVQRLSVTAILDGLRVGSGTRDHSHSEMDQARETIRRLWRRHGAKVKDGALSVRVLDKWAAVYARDGKNAGFLLPPERGAMDDGGGPRDEGVL